MCILNLCFKLFFFFFLHAEIGISWWLLSFFNLKTYLHKYFYSPTPVLLIILFSVHCRSKWKRQPTGRSGDELCLCGWERQSHVLGESDGRVACFGLFACNCTVRVECGWNGGGVQWHFVGRFVSWSHTRRGKHKTFSIFIFALSVRLYQFLKYCCCIALQVLRLTGNSDLYCQF